MTPEQEDLLDHVFEHMCEEQAEAVAELPDKEIRRRCAVGIERAQARGLEEPESITAYVSLMFLVSPRFDEQPSIAAALDDESRSERERVSTLFQRTKEKDWDAAAQLGQTWPK